jgi:succinate dehydrogenase / fumarate reductase membrane anchor subunit
MSVNYGSKRITTGARYGLRDWLAQRITAALMVRHFFSPMDEVFNFCHHPLFALSRMGWHS